MSQNRNSSNLDHAGLVDAGREIEMESFRIIESEMGPHGFPADQWQIVRRVIHTTGDFDYGRCIRIHPAAISSGVEALRKGAPIVTDTRMIKAGLAPWRLARFGTEVVTPSALPESRQWAEELGTTRSVAAFRHAAAMFAGGIVAVGNAPTALMEVIRLIREEGIRPALIVGVPVGFVSAAESKEILLGVEDQPSITVSGRKGGSSVAVAILHGLFDLAGPGTTQGT